MVYKVYVALGFHINFYHSWRGDTPDEAGFGVDIRMIREILKILNRANAGGKRVRRYWDAEVYWTFQEILPKHAPDILEAIRRRVDAGLDEIILGPYNNGANHAATADEFRAAVAWAIENPWGSGLRQLFGKLSPLYRPQETMLTTGQESIFKECGVEGLLLYYAGTPFNTLSNFIPTLTYGQRYNPFWMRTRAEQAPLAVLPCIASADLIEHVSLENLMIDLHERQKRTEINRDVLINLNQDADLESWLPVGLPGIFSWFPNSGGLEEFIRVVEKYPWAEFTVPSEYLSAHPPRTEVLVRQDMADGGFDGNYSWAEKFSSIQIWTLLEQSRLASYRAEKLSQDCGLNLDAQLWEGADSAFFKRLIGLSTTHFGMSTPVINEERCDRGLQILGSAREFAQEAERLAAEAYSKPAAPGALYDFTLYLTPPARGLPPAPAATGICLPVILPQQVKAITLEDETGKQALASLTDITALPGDKISAWVRFVTTLHPDDRQRYRILAGGPEDQHRDASVQQLKNEWLEVNFSRETGIRSFKFEGQEIGGESFLSPFITYMIGKQPCRFETMGYTFEPLDEESWQGLQRVRLKTHISIQTSDRECTTELVYTFTLFEHLPALYVDVTARYAYTPPGDTIYNLTQRLRRLMDLRWVEVAPFEMTPGLHAKLRRTLRIWKHNYLGITSHYDLDYGQINPMNRDLDSFNHQVTAGWLAVSDGQHGLLVGESARGMTSMAFCPMRLHERDGEQELSLNPFGSYYGKQFDTSHLGGNGIGSDILAAFSGALKPNGPSFNGQTLQFSLLLAPYHGDEPPSALQNLAAAHFYPPGVVIHAAREAVDAHTPDDILAAIESEQRRAALAIDTQPGPPAAFLANPSTGAVDLVWDAPRDTLVTGYEIAWKPLEAHDWQAKTIEPVNRFHLGGLMDGKAMVFKLRALSGARYSDWTSEQVCIPGPVRNMPVAPMLASVPPASLIRLILASLGAVLRALFYR